ncbi:hypothetical protein PHYPSEUDO_000947 [Phytophthora pseudosyringae]|uniref:Transmembrane protein n=1 Tax=Phytophthora pseudosyringae TaxID=221518 RepID=A0A8T1VX30_9STRA|nr:hypothetical protein PHYPSEUDO_000947 [Phytophthora pseudosyringae]
MCDVAEHLVETSLSIYSCTTSVGPSSNHELYRRMSVHAIVPAELPTRSLRRPFAVRMWTRLLRVWSRASVSRLGRYSVERVEALDKYCEQVSLLRVILVCVLTPVPSLLVELASEIIPLRDPADGWKVNSGAWIRLFIIITSTAAGSLFQVRSTTPELSYFKVFSIAFATGLGSTPALMLLASLWGYPLPFTILLMTIPAAIIFVPLVLLTIIRKGGKLIGTMKLKICLILAQAQITFLYVAFSVVFENSSNALRFGLILFLPLMKLFLKNVVARLASDNVESIPAVAVFTLDVFNALYSAICMQASGSWWTSLVMIVVNVVQTTLSISEINGAAVSFLALNHNKTAISQPKRSRVMEASPRKARERSPSLLQSARLKMYTAPSLHHINRQKPSPEVTISATQMEISSQLLFHLEYRVLVGYIEAFIPLLYAIHLSILSHLPSAEYYPPTRIPSNDQLRSTVGGILAYASTEVASLVWLHLEIKRKLGFSMLYQLAFVLETETELLQGRLFVWIVILLQLTLAHYGTFVCFKASEELAYPIVLVWFSVTS